MSTGLRTIVITGAAGRLGHAAASRFALVQFARLTI